MFRQTTLRAAMALAVLGAMALAGCGGGSSKSMGALPAVGSTPQASSGPTTGYLSVTLPNHTGAQAQSTQRTTILSSSKKPAYIDTTTPNSALVVSVTPQDPQEAAAFGNLTVCYNLYVGGTLAAANPPNFTYTNVGNTATTVTVAIPAPPGTDGFQITQYSGLCGSTPYTIPTPPPGNTGASNIIAQTPVTLAYMAPGVPNNLNVQIANCTPAPLPGAPCPLTVGGLPPGATLAASVAIASVAFGTVPIPNPVREQGAFLVAGGKIGVPIPLEAKDAAGAVIPGLTTFAVPAGGAGPFPSGVTVTDGDASGHTKLVLVDATNGAIAQGPATSITIHEFNALSDNTTPGLISTCGTGAQTCNDNPVAGGAANGDPWILMLTSDGVDATLLSSATITASAQAPNAALPTPITLTISPQSSVYSAGGTGYADLSAPAAPLSLLQPIAAGAIYFTDGNVVKVDGVNTPSAATGTTLTGLSYAPVAAPMLYAVDNTAAGGTVAPSGLYAFAVPGLAVTPVTTSDGNGHEVTFKAPVASVFANDLGTGSPKLFVIDANGIEEVDISQAGQIATNVGPLGCTGTALAAPPAGVKLFGTVAVNSASVSFLVADPGNARVAAIAVNQFNCTITTYATGGSFTGLAPLAAGALYATSTTGQIYYISGSGATAVSLGLTTAAAASTKDGPLGQLSALGAAPTGALAPVSYKTQFQAGSFFDTVGPTTGLVAPYTLAPFNGVKAVAAVPAPLVGFPDTSSAQAASVGLVNATGGIILVPASAGAAATITPDSLLFVDSAGTASAKLRTLVR